MRSRLSALHPPALALRKSTGAPCDSTRPNILGPNPFRLARRTIRAAALRRAGLILRTRDRMGSKWEIFAGLARSLISRSNCKPGRVEIIRPIAPRCDSSAVVVY